MRKFHSIRIGFVVLSMGGIMAACLPAAAQHHPKPSRASREAVN